MMSKASTRAHWSYWAIAIIALIWNGMGVANFIVQMIPGTIETYPEFERAIIAGRPIWATAAFALSVFGGVLGAVFLLLKQKTAFTLFAASFIGTILAVGETQLRGIEMGMGHLIGIVAMPLVIAAFLVWYAKFAQRQGWLD